MLSRSSDVELDFDFKKVTEKTKDNPVYYVQYCYARISSVFRNLNKDLNEEINFDKNDRRCSKLGPLLNKALRCIAVPYPTCLSSPYPWKLFAKRLIRLSRASLARMLAAEIAGERLSPRTNVF